MFFLTILRKSGGKGKVDANVLGVSGMDRAYHSLAHDMHNMRIRQMVRENDRRRVRLVLKMLSPGDRSVARDFMELLSWIKVAERRGMSEGTFRRYVLVGFVARFKEAWSKVS